MVKENSTRKGARVRKEKTEDARVQKHSQTTPVVDVELVSSRLRTTLQTLQSAMSVTIVSVEALRRQDADADTDIALVLQQNVSDRLDSEIERVSEVIAVLEMAELDGGREGKAA